MKGSEKGATLNVTKQTICFNIQLGGEVQPYTRIQTDTKIHVSRYVCCCMKDDLVNKCGMNTIKH